MKLKVNLSYVVKLDGVDDCDVLPLEDIAKNIKDDDGVWYELGGGYPVYDKKCYVRKLEDSYDFD